MQIIGWISAALLAGCCIPQTAKSLRTLRATDLSWFFLLMWLFGEILGAIYIWNDVDRRPILVNYLANIGLITPIVVVKFLNRKGEVKHGES